MSSIFGLLKKRQLHPRPKKKKKKKEEKKKKKEKEEKRRGKKEKKKKKKGNMRNCSTVFPPKGDGVVRSRWRSSNIFGDSEEISKSNLD